MMLRYAIFGSDIFTKSTVIFRFFYKKHRRKSIAMQKYPAIVKSISLILITLLLQKTGIQTSDTARSNRSFVVKQEIIGNNSHTRKIISCLNVVYL